MHIDKSTIYFNNGKQFCGKMLALPVSPRSLGKIEKWDNTLYITNMNGNCNASG
jgi:hypothetical protein